MGLTVSYLLESWQVEIVIVSTEPSCCFTPKEEVNKDKGSVWRPSSTANGNALNRQGLELKRCQCSDPPQISPAVTRNFSCALQSLAILNQHSSYGLARAEFH